MRGLLNLILLVCLAMTIAITWDKPLRDRVSEIPVIGQYVAGSSSNPPQPPLLTRTTARFQPQATPAQANGAWMWDSNHHTVLDRPAYNHTQTFTNHIYYTDNNGARYWIDGQGQRHYEP